MKVAIAQTGNRISGPGEAMEIVIYNIEGHAEVIESYENPALHATSARGIMMLRSVIERGVERLVISGAGDHAVSYASGRIKLLSGMGLTPDEALSRLVTDGLPEITAATHHSRHTH